MDVIIVGGLALTFTGTAMLFSAWRQRNRERSLLIGAGWFILLLALGCWIAAEGIEFGLLLGMMMPSLAAWGFVVWNRQVRQHKAGRNRQGKTVSRNNPDENTNSVSASGRKWKTHLLLFVLAVPVAAVITTLTCLALVQVLPMSRVNEVAVLSLVVPVLWGLVAIWLCAADKLLRPLLTLAMIGAVSAALLV